MKMYLTDSEILELLPSLNFRTDHPAHPFVPDKQVQPCSIDLHIANVFWIPQRFHNRMYRLTKLDSRRDWRRRTLDEGSHIDIPPGGIVMTRVHEQFEMPDNHAGRITGRSSYARLGLSVTCTGDFINPGWSGFMPLPLFNAGPYSIRLVPYLPICQLMLIPLKNRPSRVYGDDSLNSKYLNDDGGPSLWWLDDEVDRIHKRLQEFSVSEQARAGIVDLARKQSPAQISRLNAFFDQLRQRDVSNADELMERFALEETNRRRLDHAAIGFAGLVAASLAGSSFSDGFWLERGIGLGLLLLVAKRAVGGLLRREGGYFDEQVLRRRIAERDETDERP
jgi:deoxycytidine triphosphate deaminase